jgi:hypothetical protein
MRTPSASELLAVWEHARAQPTAKQALMLLATASPDASREDLAKLSIGRRDARLLALREVLFGSRLTGLVACPQCGRQLELSVEAGDLRTAAEQPVPETLSVTREGYSARFRLPNSEDLAALDAGEGQLRDEAAAVRELLSRCLVEIRRNGRKQNLDAARSLPPKLIEAIASEMEKADPQANVQLEFDCADCGHRWLSAFDIVSFLWKELDNWAKRILREVCLLASAFGWPEADILAMSAQRRQLYLQMIGEAS